MALQLGRLTAGLSQDCPDISEVVVAQINRNVEPEKILRAEDVHVAAMFIVSDQINTFGGKFPDDEHPKLAELLIDSPVLIGHRKDQLPIGRNFMAELVDRSGQRWVKCYFYWLRNADGAESLKANIEGGVYKECSIAFTYDLPECSICGQDIRVCEHEPGQKYSSATGESICHFNYRQIERVLETSLVYRGAVPNTRVTSESPDQVSTPRADIELTKLESLAELDSAGRYVVVPRYDGLPVVVANCDGALDVRRFDGSPIPQFQKPIQSRLHADPNSVTIGLLIGFQGKQRCTREQLEEYVVNATGPVSRLIIAEYPDVFRGVAPTKYRVTRSGLRTLPYRIVNGTEIAAAVRQIATRDGVEIWPFGAHPRHDSGYCFHPTRAIPRANEFPKCRIALNESTRQAALSFPIKRHQYQFCIVGFDSSQFASGRGFLCDAIGSTPIDHSTTLALNCDITSVRQRGASTVLEFAAPDQANLLLRGVIIGGRRRMLVRRTASTGRTCEGN